MNDFLHLCRQTVGADFVLTEASDSAPYLTDQRRRFTGKALAVVRPASTEEVAAIVRLCQQYKVPIVPQGGNTGLVLGSVPDESGQAIVLSLTRLNQIREIDARNNTMTVEAGCILENMQKAAEAAQRYFPLHLAAQGSCTIGGNLSSNAGGTAVLRYGNARELCLGLEVVTAEGDIWNGLRALRKDNSTYDLRDMYIGAEGTLGIITAAVMKLFPAPKSTLTAFVALNTPSDALALFERVQTQIDAGLTGFELISQYSLELVKKHFPALSAPISLAYPQYALIEISEQQNEEVAAAYLEQVLSDAMEAGEVVDATLATSISQAQTMWQWREHISDAQALEGKNIKHDISIPTSRIPEFILKTDRLLKQQFPACRMVTFGHLGDGNLHYNVSAPQGVSEIDFLQHQQEINRIVYDSVRAFSGSIAAEHGVGALKREEIYHYHDAIEVQLMKRIKHALDPNNLMNPGKVI